MNRAIEMLELFNDPDAVPGGQSRAIPIPVSPEGLYMKGDGLEEEFKDPGNMRFRVTGFDKRLAGSPWIGKAYTKTT